MRYLKLYEDYYSDLSFNPGGCKMINISHAIVEMISKEFRDLSDVKVVFDYINSVEFVRFIYNNFKVIIYEYEDEWFRVMISGVEWYKNGSKVSYRVVRGVGIYWCDQVRGLMQCLSDEIVS